MPQKEKIPSKILIDSKVKTAILCLTSNQIPNEENFDFVLESMQEFEDAKECRQFLFDNFYEELLDWANFNSV